MFFHTQCGEFAELRADSLPLSTSVHGFSYPRRHETGPLDLRMFGETKAVTDITAGCKQR